MEKLIIINDVSGLNPIGVEKVIRPENISQLSRIVREYSGTISIGGGRFSMGGQIAYFKSLHIDMRSLNQVIFFKPQERLIRVQAGILWRDIQRVIDEYDLSIKIMQTYSNFTVGGSMSVNAHGRYMGQGPLILSIKLFTLVLANGDLVEASKSLNPELFYAVIGGYGGLGIIAEVELELVANSKLEQQQMKLKLSDYKQYFFDTIRNNPKAQFHNADIYPPHYSKVRAISWIQTSKPVTIPNRIRRDKKHFYALERYLVWAITSTPFGKWRREHLIDPLIYRFKRVVFRNYEAGSYDVAELEPRSRLKNTYILQEYFVPVETFDVFMASMKDILQRYRVNVLNISIRHSKQDPGSLLAYAKQEVFALVLYYKQGTSLLQKNKVEVWTRELIEAAIALGGSYYLPYQLHATVLQFHKAYPRADEFFAIKKRLDPNNKFGNQFFEKYYGLNQQEKAMTTHSEFKFIFSQCNWRDKFFLFLQNIYNIYPENEFHFLIRTISESKDRDEDIYREIQKNLPKIKPFLAEIRFALPALLKQKKEMARQTIILLGEQKKIEGYVEIGSTGRYISELRKHVAIKSPIYLINDLAPSYSPPDLMERGQIRKLGTYVPLNNYNPISSLIKDESVDLVTCYVGLHHAPLDKLDAFVRSIYRCLRCGGRFIVRDHNVFSEGMRHFVSLVHTVFNAGLHVSWEDNQKELRHFTALSSLIAYLEERGFKKTGQTILQKNDPSDNTLVQFIKTI